MLGDKWTTKEVAAQLGVNTDALLQYLVQHNELRPSDRVGNLLLWSDADILALREHRSRSIATAPRGKKPTIPTGKRFNSLVVIEQAPSDNGFVMWRCVCDCGKTTVAHAHNVKAGKTKSCGCLKAKAGNDKSKYGPTKSRGKKYPGIFHLIDHYYEVDGIMRGGYEEVSDPSGVILQAGMVISNLSLLAELPKAYKRGKTKKEGIVPAHGDKWVCYCSCGEYIIVDGDDIKSGAAKSCQGKAAHNPKT